MLPGKACSSEEECPEACWSAAGTCGPYLRYSVHNRFVLVGCGPHIILRYFAFCRCFLQRSPEASKHCLVSSLPSLRACSCIDISQVEDGDEESRDGDRHGQDPTGDKLWLKFKLAHLVFKKFI